MLPLPGGRKHCVYCMHVFQIGQLYGQFEGSGNIMRHLTISDDISGAYFSMPTKGVFRRYFIFHNLSLSAHRRIIRWWILPFLRERRMHVGSLADDRPGGCQTNVDWRNITLRHPES